MTPTPHSTGPATPPATPYGTPDTPHLTVRGEAHLEVAPEIARLGITLQARGADRRETLADLTHRNTTALDLLKAHTDAVHTIETGTFSLSPELTKHGRGERVRTYRGSVHITAELTDFTPLGDLTTRLAALDLTRIDGPWWALRPDSPAHRRARRHAVHDAVQRAREYAEALGATLTALVELTDTATENTQPYGMEPYSRSLHTQGFDAAAPEEPRALDLEPARQHVYAQVTARLTMTPPVL